jgi:hypothetical protein
LNGSCGGSDACWLIAIGLAVAVATPTAFEAARLDALEADKVEALVAYWVSGDAISREFLKRIVFCV